MANDIYQGKINTISPAIGNYDYQVFINVDRGVTGASGVTGAETAVPWKWDHGITGVDGTRFTNAIRGL